MTIINQSDWQNITSIDSTSSLEWMLLSAKKKALPRKN